MTTELEQEFYDTFGIEPYFRYLLVDTQTRKKKEHLFNKTELIEFCANHKDFILLKVIKRYPDITAEKLLEMICILNKEAVYGYSDWGGKFVIGETVEELKESILTDCIRNKSEVFKQIQQLFNNLTVSEIINESEGK